MKAALPEHGTGPTGANTSIAGTQTTTNPYCRIVEPYTTPDPRAGDVYDSEGGRPDERHVVEQPRESSRRTTR